MSANATNQLFRYTNPAVPADYKCSQCGSTGCKLWQEWHPCVSRPLLCAKCAGQDQKQDISTLDKGGLKDRADRIGDCGPAVPNENGTGYWGYGHIPTVAYAWWVTLPTLPS